MTIRVAVLGFSLLAFAGAVQAQQRQSPQAQLNQPQTQEQSERQSQKQARSQVSAQRLMDAQVVDKQGREMGEIDDVVIDLHNDRVHAVVLSFGGFMGVGDKQFAFPMNELKRGKADNQFVVNVDKERLRDAQGFAKGQIPGMDDEFWTKIGGGGQGKGQAQGKQQGQKYNLVQASEMIGAQVQDKSGQPIGQVRDVVLGMDKGQLQQIVISVQGAGDARVSAQGLSSGTGDSLVLDMTREQVRAQARPAQRRAAGADQPAAGATRGSSPAGREMGARTSGSGASQSEQGSSQSQQGR